MVWSNLYTNVSPVPHFSCVVTSLILFCEGVCSANFKLLVVFETYKLDSDSNCRPIFAFLACGKAWLCHKNIGEKLRHLVAQDVVWSRLDWRLTTPTLRVRCTGVHNTVTADEAHTSRVRSAVGHYYLCTPVSPCSWTSGKNIGV